jgi:hypothetical protein
MNGGVSLGMGSWATQRHEEFRPTLIYEHQPCQALRKARPSRIFDVFVSLMKTCSAEF